LIETVPKKHLETVDSGPLRQTWRGPCRVPCVVASACLVSVAPPHDGTGL